MKKIISLFQRNYEGDRKVRDEIVPGAEWVIAGEGVATRKYDGTCCMVRDGKLYKRYDAKHGKTPPPNFEAVQDYDEVTGHMPGWVPVGDDPGDRWHREATGPNCEPVERLRDGTYELCGPKVRANAELMDRHVLIPHGYEMLPFFPRTYDKIRDALNLCTAPGRFIEGVVWHHPDGRMVKIKRTDFPATSTPEPAP